MDLTRRGFPPTCSMANGRAVRTRRHNEHEEHSFKRGALHLSTGPEQQTVQKTDGNRVPVVFSDPQDYPVKSVCGHHKERTIFGGCMLFKARHAIRDLAVYTLYIGNTQVNIMHILELKRHFNK